MDLIGHSLEGVLWSQECATRAADKGIPPGSQLLSVLLRSLASTVAVKKTSVSSVDPELEGLDGKNRTEWLCVLLCWKRKSGLFSGRKCCPGCSCEDVGITVKWCASVLTSASVNAILLHVRDFFCECVQLTTAVAQQINAVLQ